MPLTVIDIEKRKSWRISLLFVFLLFLYFALIFSLLLIPAFFIGFNSVYLGAGPLHFLTIVLFSLCMAGVHFYFSASNVAGHITTNLSAAPPDPEDGIHRQLLNITDELNVLTGKSHAIKALVIPSFSLNALALADIRGNAVIAITEGLLSRLTRPQLEAVMAHEAYHIVSGDCLESTVATSLFGMHASALEHLGELTENRFWGLHPAFLLYWSLMGLSRLLSLFISREREYRADAASLRMTRNPVAMAEVLLVLSKNWTGSGFISGGLEMLCIINPQTNKVDESEGFLADLLSTHPPIRRRIDILLRMARLNLSDLKEEDPSGQEPISASDGKQNLYYALDQRQQWQGPFPVAELAAMTWFSPVTWVASVIDQAIHKASAVSAMAAHYRNRPDESADTMTAFRCPQCSEQLFREPYEKTHVHRCRACSGILVDNSRIPRIIARRDVKCTERVKALARAVMNDHQRRRTVEKLTGKGPASKSVLTCLQCGNPMFRTFYSGAYLIEIDRCNICGITWFEPDELEMLQCVVENRITAGIPL